MNLTQALGSLLMNLSYYGIFKESDLEILWTPFYGLWQQTQGTAITVSLDSLSQS